MSGNNMESMLLDADDSSSGESDTEEVAVSGTSAVAAAVPVSAPPAPAPAAAPAAPPQSQSEMAERLKSMYSARSNPVVTGVAQQSSQHQQQVAPHSIAASASTLPTGPGGSLPSRGVPHQTVPKISASTVVSRQIPQPTAQQPKQPVARRRSSDPFEPTPVSKIIQRQQEKAAAAAVAARTAPTRAAPPALARPPSDYSHSSGGSSQRTSASALTVPSSNVTAATTAPSDPAAREHEKMKKQKDKFLIFSRVLMKYLEQKDPALHVRAKQIIRDCVERNKLKEPGYESVTKSMRTRLKEVVNDNYWKRAEVYLGHLLKQKQVAAQKAAASAGQQSSTTSRAANVQLSRATLSAGGIAPRRQSQQQSKTTKAATKQQQPRPGQQLTNLRQEIAGQRKALTAEAAAAGKNKAAGGQATKGKGASKARAPKAAAAATTTTTAVTVQRGKTAVTATPTFQQEEPVVREYAEFMEMVDHAVNYDWTTTGLLLGQKTHLQMSDEQRQLLYGDQSRPTLVQQQPLLGWSSRNVISARVAWARVRLREQKLAPVNPTVGNGLLSLPAPQGTTATTATTTASKWYNEEKAEQDMTLAVLSQGTQIYLKSVLEKALHCARQRQNVDGIRLWHQQSLPGQAALSLRLGCDVNRQVAQAAGNAAMTCKRMEEALERQSGVAARDCLLDEATLAKASSMSAVALRPKLAKGAADAELAGKRSFEIYGGKEATEPPLGRVPKKAKLEIVDFQMGMELVGPGRQRAETVSSAFAF